MNFAFDLVIFSFLITDGALAIILALHLRKFGWPSRAGMILSALAWLVVFYGSFIEPQIVVVREQVVNLDAAQTSLRAVLVGDFHLGPYKKTAFMERIVAKTNALKPDVIFLGGDFVFDNRNQAEFLEPLKNLHAPLGVYAILGNHDYGETTGPGDKITELRGKTVRQKLETLGIEMLVNKGVVLKVGGVNGGTSNDANGGKEINLLGVDDLWFGKSDIDKALSGIDAAPRLNNLNILLSHNPDVIWDAKEKGMDFVITAHTHGGQIRLPFWGAVAEIPDRLGQKFDKGLFAFDKTQLYITSGVGEVGPRARLFNPPEIVLLKINF